MRILYLYRSMRCGDADYHASQRFTALLERRHRIQYKYAVIPDQDYDRCSPADPGHPEWLSDTSFLAQRFDSVILDGQLFASAGLPRIPFEVLHKFHNGGGSLLLLLDPSEVDSMFRADHGLQLTDFFRATGHSQGIPLHENGSIVKGYLRGSSQFRIQMNDVVRNALPRFVTETVYQQVNALEVASPIHLGPFGDPLCVGDQHIRLFNTDDEPSFLSGPLVFGNMTRGTGGSGATASLTGLMWLDSIASIPGNDNLRLLENLVWFFDGLLREDYSYHRMPLVFVSYSHADLEIVTELVARLQSAGAEVWHDQQEMGAGESISRNCEAGILKADYVVVLVTPNSLCSAWVMWEMDTAQRLCAKDGHRPKTIPIVTGVKHADVIQRLPATHDISYVRLDEDGAIEAVARAIGL